MKVMRTVKANKILIKCEKRFLCQGYLLLIHVCLLSRNTKLVLVLHNYEGKGSG